MPTLRLVVEYDGGSFHGFAAQAGVPTLRAAIEGALLRLTGEGIAIRYASRTDAGVHARGQVIAFEVARGDIPIVGFVRGLSSLLGPEIVVREGAQVESGWCPRRAARGKRYRYTFWNAPQPPALERARAWWVRGALDVEAMHAAAQRLLGTHDFESFRATGCTARHARRIMYSAEVRRGEHAAVVFEIVGNAFVKNMVRIMAGTLRDVGLGKRVDVDAILAARDRAAAGQTAPPHGLVLEEIIYDDRLPPKPRETP